MAQPSQSRRHDMPFGASLTAAGCRFRLWAPGVTEATLCVENPGDTREIACRTDAQGWADIVADGVTAGTLYRWKLGPDVMVPDPASRFQPQDVHGPSEVVDPQAFGWTDGEWIGRPWPETVLYELHVGTFTPAGTFRAAAER